MRKAYGSSQADGERNSNLPVGSFYCAETLIIIVLCSLCRKNTVCERCDFDFYPCVILQSEKVKCIIEIR